MPFARVTLAVTALTFAGFGVAFLVAPTELVGLVHVGVPDGLARAEIRTMYGGLELGFAAFLFACVRRTPWVPLGCLAGALVLGGMGLTRLTCGGVERVTDSLWYLLAGAELSGSLLCAVATLVARRPALPVAPDAPAPAADAHPLPPG